MKRAFDILLAFAALMAMWPLLLLIALLVKLESPGPAIFKQQRIGRGFRPFTIFKFRTMRKDAPQKGRQITSAADARITRLGRVLRNTKLDELPQLVNVLRGQMSFVGPRPEVPRYVEMFRDDFREILKVSPGMTDFASLKYRTEERILAQYDNPEEGYIERVLPDKILLAKEYVKKSSLFLDVSLIAKTLKSVLLGSS